MSGVSFAEIPMGFSFDIKMFPFLCWAISLCFEYSKHSNVTGTVIRVSTGSGRLHGEAGLSGHPYCWVVSRLHASIIGRAMLNFDIAQCSVRSIRWIRCWTALGIPACPIAVRGSHLRPVQVGAGYAEGYELVGTGTAFTRQRPVGTDAGSGANASNLGISCQRLAESALMSVRNNVPTGGLG